jgi:hypothetical protein
MRSDMASKGRCQRADPRPEEAPGSGISGRLLALETAPPQTFCFLAAELRGWSDGEEFDDLELPGCLTEPLPVGVIGALGVDEV